MASPQVSKNGRQRFSLQASERGLEKIRQARFDRHWAIHDERWLIEASIVIAPDPKLVALYKQGIYAEGISLPTWKNFLKRNPIRPDSFKAFCQVLGLDYKEIVDWEEIYSENLYIERPPLERNCYDEIVKPGSLLRIKAPKYMGKTRLVSHIMQKLEREKPEYFPLKVDFQLGDSTVFNNLERFCKWFCGTVGNELELENKLTEHWEDVCGCNQNTTAYFQRYLLQEINTPKVLILDNVDLVFEHREIATDFCNLLRNWYETAKSGTNASKNWQKLRLVIVHSTDVYGSININCSPLAGVGTLVELQEFTEEQVQKLVKKYSLNLESKEFKELMELVKGNPYLVDLALKKASTGTPLTQLLQMAATGAGIYSEHLRDILGRIKQNSELAAALKEVVNSPEPVGLESVTAFKLQSMGLIKLSGDLATPRYELYRRYYRERL
jgi:hypothetical protein